MLHRTAPLDLVAALYCRSDSIYHRLDGVDVWDQARDARLWPGGHPCVAHPPCGQWGRLRKFAHPDREQRDLALIAVNQVRHNAGVLEHPAYSSLWAEADLPMPGKGFDPHGGWTFPVTQHWFGHLAEKSTWLYIVGILPNQLPPVPLSLHQATHVVGTSRGQRHRNHLPKSQRDITPQPFAEWLVDLARRTASPF